MYQIGANIETCIWKVPNYLITTENKLTINKPITKTNRAALEYGTRYDTQFPNK